MHQVFSCAGCCLGSQLELLHPTLAGSVSDQSDADCLWLLLAAVREENVEGLTEKSFLKLWCVQEARSVRSVKLSLNKNLHNWLDCLVLCCISLWADLSDKNFLSFPWAQKLCLCLFSSLESSWNQLDQQESYRYSHIVAANSCQVQEGPGGAVPSVLPPEHGEQGAGAGAPGLCRWVSPRGAETWQCLLGSYHCCNQDWLGRGVPVDFTQNSQSYKCER